jgi:uncharacterized protein (DUF952 family)
MEGTPRVHHVAHVADWPVAGGAQEYRHPSLAAEGFIHCSTAEQLPGTVAAHFSPDDDLVVLTVEVDRLTHELRWEPSRHGDLFPHLYGPLDVAAVVEARQWEWPGAGSG